MDSTSMTLLRRQHAHGAKLSSQHQSRWADKRRAPLEQRRFSGWGGVGRVDVGDGACPPLARGLLWERFASVSHHLEAKGSPTQEVRERRDAAAEGA